MSGDAGLSLVSSPLSQPAGQDRSQWFAVHTRARHETRVFYELQNQSICGFVPMICEVHRWTDRRKIVNVPLFPCYTFVRLIPSPEVRLRVLQTPGVLRLVGFGGKPAPIPEEQIHSIKRVLARNVPFSSCGFLSLGQRVRIRGGALEGVEGILVGRNGDRKLVISIELIHQSIAIVVEGYDIEPIGELSAVA
jgi:transcription antitermination factor NusG